MRIVVTGGEGFIGRNLRVRLAELGYDDVKSITSGTPSGVLEDLMASADFVYHLAGANRPPNPAEFERVNATFTRRLCAMLDVAGRKAAIAFSSSTQVEQANPYGESKRSGEDAIRRYGSAVGAPAYILRFPNVFGKWSRPNYNSAVATFCYNLTRGIPITVNDPASPITLLYIDDAVSALVGLLDKPPAGLVSASPTYSTTVGEIAALLEYFNRNRHSLDIAPVGKGLPRALYATYLSFCPPESFAYPLTAHTDSRGTFVEILKTLDSGQISFFTAHPGVTRGGHYHHTKNEKFLIVQGEARFGFRNLLTGEQHEVRSSGKSPTIVETVPGWVHDVTNVGDSEMIAVVWANEVFDREAPDTITSPVNPLKA